MRKVTAAEPYSMDEARRDVFAAILRVVARDMEAEIDAGDRLQREGKGTPDGLLPPEAIPLCLAATREVLAEMRRRAAAPSPPETPRSPAPRDAADDYADPAPHSDSCVGRIHDSLGCSCRPDPAALAPRDGDPRFAAICRALRVTPEERVRALEEALSDLVRFQPEEGRAHRSHYAEHGMLCLAAYDGTGACDCGWTEWKAAEDLARRALASRSPAPTPSKEDPTP